jgi:feruloyl-CoA synthase
MQDIRPLPPFKPVNFLPRDIDVDRRADGTIILLNRIPLQQPYAAHIPALLRRWAKAAPDRVFLAQRRGPDRAWKTITYAEAQATVDRLTQALLDLGIGEQRPVMILSGNSIEHALMMFAAMQARAPVASISPAYSLMGRDFGKLKHVFELVAPALVLVQDGAPFAKALGSLDLDGVTVVHVEAPVPGMTTTAFDKLAATPATDAVARSIAAISPKTIGKLLFTSGSTAMPKAVIITQEMMCANAAMVQQCRPRAPGDPTLVMLAWAPWSHIAGGNVAMHGTLSEGGTQYIDDGRPVPGQFEETVRNLREVTPTSFFNVPAGYAALIPVLERDDELARKFLSGVQYLSFGSAALPSDLFARMQALSIKHTGQRIQFLSSYGATEAGPYASAVFWETDRLGLIGLPVPGFELKMIPIGALAEGKYELRLRSIAVTPGYYKRPDLTAAAFDEEGFYRIGDAAAFADVNDPLQGLVFAGRVVEDFKLTTGTFVQVGTLRVAAVAAASPVIQDAVVTGQDRSYAGLLAWPNLMACRQLMGKLETTPADVIEDARVIAKVCAGLAAHNTANPGSSTQIRRVILMAEPASIDAGELTDKGYINQRTTLQRRADLVARLYAEEPGPDVIVVR